MDPKQFTEKVTSLLNAAQQLASEHSHQSLTPTHVAIVMFEDEGGVARAALARQAAAGSDSLASVLRTLKKQLVGACWGRCPNFVWLEAEAAAPKQRPARCGLRIKRADEDLRTPMKHMASAMFPYLQMSDLLLLCLATGAPASSHQRRRQRRRVHQPGAAARAAGSCQAAEEKGRLVPR